MKDWQLSILRSLMKMAGTALVSHGVLEAMDLPVLQVAIEAAAGSLIAVVGIWLSHKTHAAAKQ